MMGDEFIHSVEEGMLLYEMCLRDLVIPSQITHMKRMTDKNEINEPSEETMFHVVKASG
jgi:hypothetical protein